MFEPRMIKIKAWDIEAQLMKRLGSVVCTKSQLVKPGHVLLQYTGMVDQDDTEIYDGDVLLYDHKKHLVSWNAEMHEWQWTPVTSLENKKRFTPDQSRLCYRLCHWYESLKKSE